MKLGGWGRIKEGDCGFGEERERTLEERESSGKEGVRWSGV